MPQRGPGRVAGNPHLVRERSLIRRRSPLGSRDEWRLNVETRLFAAPIAAFGAFAELRGTARTKLPSLPRLVRKLGARRSATG